MKTQMILVFAISLGIALAGIATASPYNYSPAPEILMPRAIPAPVLVTCCGDPIPQCPPVCAKNHPK